MPRTALLIEILQIVGGLVLVIFAGMRLLRLTKSSGKSQAISKPPAGKDPDSGGEQ